MPRDAAAVTIRARGPRVSRAPLRVALLGAGTVGREVARALIERGPELTPDGGAPLELAGIAVRDLDRARAAGLPADLLTDGPAHLVAAPDTDVVVELMGGDEPAHTLIAAALSAGKSVVTANKHVIAHHGPELEAIARRTGAALRFEAAVGGGIPILGPLAGDLAADRVERVRGIVNGTTNFMLSAMTDETAPLAFDRWLDPGAITTRPDGIDGPAGPGITTVSLADQGEAREAGRIIRLVAHAARDEDDRLTAAVLATALPRDSALGRTAGVRNRIEVDATPAGHLGFDGPGAGGAATSSAVLGDLIAVAREMGSTWGPRRAAVRAAAGEVGRPNGDVLETASGVRYPIDD